MADPRGATRLSITPGSVFRAVVLVAGWLVLLAVVGRARGPLVLFAMGMLVAALVLPLVGLLGRWMPRWVAVVLVSLLTAGVVGFVGYRAIDEVDRQADRLADAIDEGVARIEASGRYGEWADRLDLSGRADQVTSTLRDEVSLDASRLTELAPTLASGAGDVFVIWLFAVMLMAAGPQFVRSFVGLFPSPATRARVHDVIRYAHGRTVRYAGLMLLRAVAWFAVTFLAAVLLGLRVPTVLGIVVAFLSLFPCFGLLLGGVLFAISTALRSPDLVVPIVVLAVVVQALDVVLVQRRIEDRSVAVRSLLVIVAVLLGWSVEGVRGVVLATVGVTFAVAAVERALAVRDGEVPDPADALPAAEREPGPQVVEALP